MTELTIDEALKKGIEAHKAGNIQEADRFYTAILKAEPNNADANHNLGILVVAVGKTEQALPLLKKALEANPRIDQYWLSYISAFIKLGKTKEAKRILNQAKRKGVKGDAFDQLEEQLNQLNLKKITEPFQEDLQFLINLYNQGQFQQVLKKARYLLRQFPNSIALYNIKGVAHSALKQFDIAIDCYKQALEKKPDYAKAYNNMGATLKDQGKLDKAIESYKQAIKIKPGYPEAYNNLGLALGDKGDLNAAIDCYKRSLKTKPDYHEAYYNMGITLKQQEYLKEAIESYKQAIKIKPDYPEAYNNIGIALKDQGNLAGAKDSFKNAIRIKPDYAEAHNNMGNTLKDQGNLKAAINSYKHAIKIKPDFVEAYCNRAIILKELGLVEEAIEDYDKAISFLKNTSQTERDLVKYCIQKYLILPVIMENNKSIDYWRDKFTHALSFVSSHVREIPEKEISMCSNSSFYLSYHGRNNRLIMQKLKDFYRSKAKFLNYQAPRIEHKPDKAIVLGICTNGFHNHSVGLWYKGIVQNLNKNRFRIILFYPPGSKKDQISSFFDTMVDKSVQLPDSFTEQRESIVKEHLDALFYPNPIESWTTYFLAYNRLSPVQFTSLGFIDTTGIDSIDYYLSAASIEPHDADNHYSERLIRLPRLPSGFQRLETIVQASDRETLGLPQSGMLYGCPQNLFKLHPDFDRILEEIILGDPESHVVLFEGKYDSWTKLLRQRWKKNAPILNDQVYFLSRQPMDKFLSSLKQFDVLLDPVHFGSGITMYEAIMFGIPIITWPGEFMRGRLVAGAYKQMCLEDAPIAETLETYSETALAWGKDASRRIAFRKACHKASDMHLFNDLKAVHEFETFIKKAVSASRRGTILPKGWPSGGSI